MLLRAYTLHDVKALNYSPPFFVNNDALAIRMLTDLVNDRNTSVGRHPGDFKMYCVGTYEDAKGVLNPLPIPEHIMDAVSCVAASPPNLFGALRKE